MEMKQHDVLVVSAFGRGHWLATELQKEHMNVLLLDLTSSLGPWPPEDGEGPFGIVRLERYSQSFLEHLAHGDPVETVDNGLCLWLPDGPLEFKGPLTRFHWEQRGLPVRWLEALSQGNKSENLGTSEFTKIWPMALSHQISATRYLPSAAATEAGRPLPMAASFGLRFATRQGLLKNLDWVRGKGVTTSDKTQILDLSFQSRRELSGVELKGEISGLKKFDQVVWTLTGGETRFLSTRLQEDLYPGGVVEASWCWVRYRLTVQMCPEVDRLPLHLVVLEDVESPWTHSNLLILQKTPSERSLDAWIRIPANQRFNRDYLTEHGRRIAETIRRRMPLSQPEIQSLPQEASYTSQELGEPRAPIWDWARSPASGRLSASNLHFESPENRENHSLDAEFDHQKMLVDRLSHWWRQKQLKLQKQNKENEL
jgi:hypothetical protein